MPDVPVKNNLVFSELGQIDPRELSPHVPIRWADFPLESRLYNSAYEEYVRSPYPVGIKTLRERWRGLFDDNSLKLLRETSEWKADRLRYQDDVAKNAITQSLAGDIEFQKRRIDREIVELCALIEKVNHDISAGYEYAGSKNAGPLGYVQKPLSVDSLSKLGNLRIALSDALAKRLGLANDVLKITVGVEETLEQRMNRFMAENDDEYAQLKNVVEMGALPQARISGTQGDNALSEYHAEREAGRVIDVTPLPRATQTMPKSSTR